MSLVQAVRVRKSVALVSDGRLSTSRIRVHLQDNHRPRFGDKPARQALVAILPTLSGMLRTVQFPDTILQ